MVVRLRQLLVSRLLSRSLRCSEMGSGPTLYLMSHVGGARTPPSMSVEGEEKGGGAGRGGGAGGFHSLYPETVALSGRLR